MKIIILTILIVITGCNHVKPLSGSGNHHTKPDLTKTRSIATSIHYAHDNNHPSSTDIIDDSSLLSPINTCRKQFDQTPLSHHINDVSIYKHHAAHLLYSKDQYELYSPSATFLQNEYRLSKQMKKELKQFSAQLSQLESPYQLVIIGHTNKDGSFDINKRLSYNRANFVGDYLINNNIHKNNISIVGIADKLPIPNMTNNLSHLKNRRVEILVFQPSNCFSDKMEQPYEA